VIDSQADLRHDLLWYNLLQVECGLWVPVDFRTIGHLIPDCTKHYRRSSRTYLERTAMGAVGDCTVLILRDFGCCVSHSSVLIVRPLSMAATSRWLIDVSFCRAIFFAHPPSLWYLPLVRYPHISGRNYIGAISLA